MEQPASQYQSYLLRLWRASEGETWRVLLEHVGTHERHGFADLDGLCTFLREQMMHDIQISGKFGKERRLIS